MMLIQYIYIFISWTNDKEAVQKPCAKTRGASTSRCGHAFRGVRLFRAALSIADKICGAIEIYTLYEAPRNNDSLHGFAVPRSKVDCRHI